MSHTKEIASPRIKHGVDDTFKLDTELDIL